MTKQPAFLFLFCSLVGITSAQLFITKGVSYPDGTGWHLRLYDRNNDGKFDVVKKFDGQNGNARISAGHADFVSLVDLDADGDKDLVVTQGGRVAYANNANKLIATFYENVGDDTNPDFVEVDKDVSPLKSIHTECEDHTDIWRELKQNMAWGDMDGDGDFDCLALGDDEAVYYENIGTPTQANFEMKLYVEHTQTPQIGTDHFFSVLQNHAHGSPTLLDLDGDGDLDLAIGNVHGVTVYKNVGSATSPSFERDWDMSGQFPNDMGYARTDTSLTIWDAGNDGDWDLVAASQVHVAFRENTGNSTEPSWQNRDDFSLITSNFMHLDINFFNFDPYLGNGPTPTGPNPWTMAADADNVYRCKGDTRCQVNSPSARQRWAIVDKPEGVIFSSPGALTPFTTTDGFAVEVTNENVQLSLGNKALIFPFACACI